MMNNLRLLSKSDPPLRQRALARVLILLAVSLFASSCGPKAGPVAAGAASGVCPVCQMNVKADDPWAAEIHYTDGMKLMFESPGDLITFYQSPMQYKVPDEKKARANIAENRLQGLSNERAG